MALTTKRVRAGNAMVDVWRGCFYRFIPAMIVDVVEGLSDFFLTMLPYSIVGLHRMSRKIKAHQFPCFQTQSAVVAAAISSSGQFTSASARRCTPVPDDTVTSLPDLEKA